VVDCVCEVPGGAHPSYAHGYYQRDNAFCQAWDEISKDRQRFLAWMDQHILSTSDFAEYRRSISADVGASQRA
jgi:glutaconate CoA-transferase, subunit A